MAKEIIGVTKSPFRQGNLEGPLLIIAAGPAELFLVRVGDEDDPDAECQMYELDHAALFDQIKPFSVWLKFMYYVDGVVPPVPFSEAEAAQRVRVYQAAKRARDAADAEAEAAFQAGQKGE